MQQAGGGAGFGLSAHEIYEQVTGGPGTGSMDAAYEATRLEVELEGQRAQEIVRLADAIKQGWEGEAADAAVGAAAPMADTAWERSEYLRRAQTALEEQGVNFRYTLNSVVPVPANPPESNIVNDVIPWETDLDADIKQYQENAQNNIVVYGGYDKYSLDNELRLPRDYPSTTDWSGDISVMGAPPEGGRPPSGGEFQPRGSSWVPGDGPDSGAGSGEGPPLSVGDPQREPVVGPPVQGTDPSDTASPGVRPPVVVPQPPGNPPTGSQPPVGGWPPGVASPPGGRRPGLGPESGRGAGAGGPFGRGGGAEGGPGGRNAGGPGASGGVPGEPGGRPGAGAVASEEAARRAGLGAAARGAGVAGGFAPVGVGRPAGAGDEEHQRKYTVEPDPEEMFGSDERTAPPVIGVEEE